MKVFLVAPRTDRVIASELPGHVTQEVGSFPPLGLFYLAAGLRAAGHEPVIIDMATRDLRPEELGRQVRAEAPGLVGITAITHNLVGVQEAAAGIRAFAPQVPICMGGPHVNAFGPEALSLDEVDYAIAGEGEEALPELIEALAQERDFAAVPGLYYRTEEGVATGAPASYPTDLEGLPFPARDLLPADDYFYVLGGRATFATIIASRGCPFHCTFCSTPHGGYRFRSPEHVADEVEQVLATGVDEIHFVDDTFNLGKGRLAAISQALIDRKLPVRWSFRGRADGIDDEGLRLAKEAGCIRFHIGVETGTDEGLKRLKKGVTLAEVRQAVELARKHEIVAATYFILGCPHEPTAADVQRTIEFAVALDPDFAMFNILAIYPNTELFDEAVAKGLVDPDLWTRFARNPDPDFLIPLWTEHLDRETLQELLQQAYRRFYLRPKLIWRNMRELSSLAELRRKAQAGLSILLGRS